jgi:hypothetical protein
MWWTGRGNQVLRGAEWDLFREGLGFLKGMIEETFDDPDDDLTGIAAFDRLQPSQQLAMLAAVGQAIRDEQTPAPDLTELSEGTVAAVYRCIRNQVQYEIDMSEEDDAADSESWRSLVLAAYRQIETEGEDVILQPPAPTEAVPPAATMEGEPDGENFDDEEEIDDGTPPGPTSRNMGDWEDVIDDVSRRILWDDEDYEDGEVFLDADPKIAARLRNQLGIDRQY